MSCWIETFGVLCVCGLAILLGLRSKHLGRTIWLSVYIISLLLVLIVNIPMGTFGIEPSRFLRFLTAGRREFIILSFAVVLMFSVLIPNLKRKPAKVFLGFLIAVSIIYFAITPFLTPFFIREKLASLQTQFEGQVCLQSTSFTSGPAAAVTALKQIGINAQEGIIAIDSYTTPLWGTDEDLLASAIKNLYGRAGVSCKVRFFNSVSELAENCPVIAVVRYSFLVDQYVTVLDVRGKFLIIADSLQGIVRMSFDEFEKIWRFRGIVVSKAGKIIFI